MANANLQPDLFHITSGGIEAASTLVAPAMTDAWYDAGPPCQPPKKIEPRNAGHLPRGQQELHLVASETGRNPCEGRGRAASTHPRDQNRSSYWTLDKRWTGLGATTSMRNAKTRRDKRRLR
jgi:hypothetical protein